MKMSSAELNLLKNIFIWDFIHGFIVNVHGVALSIIQLKRILRGKGFQRIKEPSNFEEVVRFINMELASNLIQLG